MTATAGIGTYNDITVVANTTYYYRVRASNTAGNSAWSNTASVVTPSIVNAAQVYSQNCASCHGVNRQGGSGPALTPTSLASRTITWLVSFIQSHRTGSGLTQTVINALTDFLKNTPP
jgi:mono/diheme cytochrome c family protein